ncbi:hypothetical protein [Halothiobacillus neapolitanus]|uniref:CopG domain protein DNA-binding domain protein n=1 Tax=Halothiobacillus neapolitanus (strain ATCC 23641 / DSM 15147 / CIP 104769 / NCIMB 8539 / c2) TaxID=555778 RepID=D0L193_HALNC|nr:hypothetical protein [Halothiobacillus neapolitanus]ACX96466.1 hypothetical protein Hneap_1640 [Halothiobacillus neapolitanus c2]TDN66783.1 hypothetical protein C8D83_1011122 [Halothiobacillus neapolitanus]
MKSRGIPKTALIRLRVTEEESAMLKSLANSEKKSTSSLLREMVLTDLRSTQRASAMENHILEFERRLVNTLGYLTKEMRRLNSTEQVTLSAIDIFLRTYLTHTPPIQEANREFARQEAKRRYDEIITAIHRGLSDDFGITEVARTFLTSEENGNERQ